MSGVKAWRTRHGVPLIDHKPLRVSQTIVWGDIMVLGANTLVNRLVLATDAYLEDIAKGLWGFAWHDITVDANGALTQTIPSTVETAAAVIHPIPSFSRLMHRLSQPLIGTTPDIGNIEMQVCVFTDDLEVLMDVSSSEGVATVTQAIVGEFYGLVNDGGVYKVDLATAASVTEAAVQVMEVDTTQTNFNVSAETNNAVWVRVRAAAQQYNNGSVPHT